MAKKIEIIDHKEIPICRREMQDVLDTIEEYIREELLIHGECYVHVMSKQELPSTSIEVTHERPDGDWEETT